MSSATWLLDFNSKFVILLFLSNIVTSFVSEPNPVLPEIGELITIKSKFFLFNFSLPKVKESVVSNAKPTSVCLSDLFSPAHFRMSGFLIR